MYDHALGVDIGGTKIRFVLIDRAGHVLASYRLSTGASDGPEAVLDRVTEGIQHVLDRAPSPVVGIGIGCPGHINPDSGIVQMASNLDWWEPIALNDGIRQRLNSDLPIQLAIDANANALGELYFGAGRGCQDFVYVAIGTGLGGSAVINGRLLQGANAYAMEIGHFGLDWEGRQCVCGMKGCPEMVVSGIGLSAGVEAYRTAYPHSQLAKQVAPTTAQILAAARSRDPLALHVMAEAQEMLCRVLACCVALFNPARLIIGGGLGHAAADYFITGINDQLLQRTLPMSHYQLVIAESEVSNSAIGAACLVWHFLEGKR